MLLKLSQRFDGTSPDSRRVGEQHRGRKHDLAALTFERELAEGDQQGERGFPERMGRGESAEGAGTTSPGPGRGGLGGGGGAAAGGGQGLVSRCAKGGGGGGAGRRRAAVRAW